MYQFSYNEKYLTRNGKPWFPIMGEMHYSRYDKRFWKESLYKMKSGMVDVVSTYSIWIHHEEIEGTYDFTGNRNLREFVETCKECKVFMFLRVGPWIHGEVRNGGFPDWLLEKYKDRVRTNDPAYMAEVKKYYEKLYDQVKGLLLKDGGPIIGIQVENEYGHCGGLIGEDGERHMRDLTAMLKTVGFDVPLYTATGWGGAVTGGLIPVMGGYCESPWDQRLTEIEPSGNYIFTHERNDHNIGNDFGLGTGITFDMKKFPYLTAELGGGLQVTHHRRPVASGTDIGAVSLVKMGSGVNLLGYYMYHGGTNPEGRLTTLQESRATGYLNDLPEKSYDFNGPIKEFGQMSDTFHEIRVLGMFIRDFGEEFCKMPALIPEDNPLFPDNYDDLRYAFRHNGKSGFVFVSNYQRRHVMKEQNVALAVRLKEEIIQFPEISVKDKEYFFLPFYMPVGKALLKTALVTPLCRIGKDYVFYGDREPCYEIEGDLLDTKLLTISREDALRSWKVMLDKEYLFLTDAKVVEMENIVQFIGDDDFEVKVYPEPQMGLQGFERKGTVGDFTVFVRNQKKAEAAVKVTPVLETKETSVYELDIKVMGVVNDAFLTISYSGDTAKIFAGELLLTDNFYTGQLWEIGLKQFDFPEKLRIEITGLKENAERFLETWPDMVDGAACRMEEAEIICEYECTIDK